MIHPARVTCTAARWRTTRRFARTGAKLPPATMTGSMMWVAWQWRQRARRGPRARMVVPGWVAQGAGSGVLHGCSGPLHAGQV